MREYSRAYSYIVLRKGENYKRVLARRQEVKWWCDVVKETLTAFNKGDR
jgi:hypothetical protein